MFSMIRGAVVASALTLAIPAAAQLRDYTAEFDAFAMTTMTMPVQERVEAFRAKFDALVPGFYAPRGGIPEDRFNLRVQRALEAYPALRDRYLAASRSFGTAYRTADKRFRKFFPGFAPTMPVYLLHSLSEMDGGTRELRGGPAAIFGADVIAQIHDPASIPVFLDHELFHIHHARTFKDCDQLWCSLWQEGLATYVAHRLNPHADDRMLLLTFPRPIRPDVDARLNEAMCLTRASFDSTDKQINAGFFAMNGKGAFPPRFGYYVGYRLAEQLGGRMSLDQLAKLSPSRVRTLLQQKLAGYSCPPA